MRGRTYAIVLAALTGCGTESPLTQPTDLVGPTASVAPPSYTLALLPGLGGTQSRGMAINEQGWVAGWSLTAANATRQAVLWRAGAVVPLGTLGGPNSTVQWPGLNEEGMVVGISQTGVVDPLQEAWSCELGGFIPTTNPRQACKGFAWENDVMQALPTLGGTHGFATAVNDLGQIVGWAEAAGRDTTCADAQQLAFRAVMWEPKKNRTKMRELAPYPGDVASAATAVNNAGQAVGISGRCDQAVGRYSALRAVLWEKNGRVTKLPTLTGTSWHTPMDLNEQGDVVGFGNPAGPADAAGEFDARGFLWLHGSPSVTTLLLPGDANSQAFAINAGRQVVGISFGGAAGARGFLYRDGVLHDLNQLVVKDPLDPILSAQDINDAGQITGRIRDHLTGEVRAFIATPIVAP
jgi:probable HAF family extracellular repeat protein